MRATVKSAVPDIENRLGEVIMVDVKKSCPKCGAEMKKKILHKWGSAGWSITPVNLLTPYVCEKCGYVEFYAK